MRTALLVFLLLIVSSPATARDSEIIPSKNTKGQFFLYYGWNRAWYSESKIHFQGNDFDFTLSHVAAHDKVTPFNVDPYLNPLALTIPQTNFRLGYFFKNNWSFSFGVDHMKYVVSQYQDVKISGTIQNTGTGYDGIYHNETIEIVPEFLKFEHTNGLNYANIEVRHQSNLVNLKKYKLGNIDINLSEGIGAGILYPKTDATIVGKPRNDEFHFSGYGISLLGALNITFLNHFFIQTELKGGFINMPFIRITADNNEKASQHFFFIQPNLLFGTYFRLWKEKQNPIPPSVN